MSVIKSQIFTGVKFDTFDPDIKLYKVRIACGNVTQNVIDNGTVLISFKESNTGAAWMGMPFALPNNYWVYSYDLGYVEIVNTNGDFKQLADYKVVTVEAD